MPYSDIIETFPEELRSPLYRLVERLQEETLQTVRRSDLEALTGIVHTLGERVLELAAAQQRTEARLEQLAEAQQRTEARVEELAAAQQRTETEVRKLAKGLRETREMVGGLSHTIGYGLEDRAFPLLPALLQRDFDVHVGRLVRRFVTFPDGAAEEVNIYGEGERQGQRIVVIGEAKAQLGRRDIDRFLRKVQRLRTTLAMEVLPLVLTYVVPPQVEQHARSKGVAVYWSHDLLT